MVSQDFTESHLGLFRSMSIVEHTTRGEVLETKHDRTLLHSSRRLVIEDGGRGY
jgi:hypothetical protein